MRWSHVMKLWSVKGLVAIISWYKIITTLLRYMYTHKTTHKTTKNRLSCRSRASEKCNIKLVITRTQYSCNCTRYLSTVGKRGWRLQPKAREQRAGACHLSSGHPALGSRPRETGEPQSGLPSALTCKVNTCYFSRKQLLPFYFALCR